MTRRGPRLLHVTGRVLLCKPVTTFLSSSSRLSMSTPFCTYSCAQAQFMQTCLNLYLHYNGHFPGGLGLAGTSMSPV